LEVIFVVALTVLGGRPSGLRGDGVRPEGFAELEYTSGVVCAQGSEVLHVLSLEEREVSGEEGLGGARHPMILHEF
jgi:hypothetical protein